MSRLFKPRVSNLGTFPEISGNVLISSHAYHMERGGGLLRSAQPNSKGIPMNPKTHVVQAPLSENTLVEHLAQC